MKTLKMKQASKALADYVAALVPLKDVDRESLSLSLNPAFMKIIRRARAEVRRGNVYSLEQVKREMLTETGAPNKASHRTRQTSARR